MKVLLAGVSCVGKSTIGAELAALLGIPFFDLDTEVEAFFQMSIGLLQAQCGSMHAYRNKACRVLRALLSRTDTQDCVIALPPSGLMVPYWNAVKGTEHSNAGHDDGRLTGASQSLVGRVGGEHGEPTQLQVVGIHVAAVVVRFNQEHDNASSWPRSLE